MVDHLSSFSSPNDVTENGVSRFSPTRLIANVAKLPLCFRLKLLLCCTWKSELQGLLLLPISYHALATRNVGDMKVLTFKHYVVGQQSTVVMEELNILKFLQGTAIATLIEKNVHGLLSPQEGWLNMR